MILLDPSLTAAVSAAPQNPKTVQPNDRLPSTRSLTQFLRTAQAAMRLRGMVSVLLTTDEAIRRLNRTFRGKNRATDVLSFPAAEMSRGEVAGDLAISVPTAREQAREHGHALGVEIKILMLHGLLHLAGYDHETDEGQMARRERVLRAKLALPLGLIERSHAHSTLAPEKKRKNGAMGSRLEDKQKQKPKQPPILGPPRRAQDDSRSGRRRT
jgi:probable rRNA maturation factor